MHKLPPFQGDPSEDTAVSEYVETNRPAEKAPLWMWVAGAVLVALLGVGMAAAGNVDKDCKRVPGGQGQTLNVCVDSQGNISDGDR